MASAILKPTFVFLLATLFARPLSPSTTPVFVVWNVGQGQWLTRVETLVCLHFDAGGERSPIIEVQKSCSAKFNIFFFSHWDFDHLNFNSTARRSLKTTCLWNLPPGQSSAAKMAALRKWQICPPGVRKNWLGKIQIIFRPEAQGRVKGLKSNESSQVYAYGSWLIPGDSPRSMEKRWAGRLTGKSVRHLLLGHHGSQTSTSKELLSHLTHLQVAVASSRRVRYGHPHREIELRLQQGGIALLKTEDWGHLRFTD